MGLYVATAKVMKCQAEGCVSDPAENGKLRTVLGSSPEAAKANLDLLVAACEQSRRSGYHCRMAKETIEVKEADFLDILEANLCLNNLIGGYGSL